MDPRRCRHCNEKLSGNFIELRYDPLCTNRFANAVEDVCRRCYENLAATPAALDACTIRSAKNAALGPGG